MSVEHLSSTLATIGGSFFAGALIGFALKKVLKILAIVVGLFFAGVAYLQQIVNINWDRRESARGLFQRSTSQYDPSKILFEDINRYILELFLRQSRLKLDASRIPDLMMFMNG